MNKQLAIQMIFVHNAIGTERLQSLSRSFCGTKINGAAATMVRSHRKRRQQLQWCGATESGVSSFNGAKLNGAKLNGVKLNGVKLNGAEPPQAASNGRANKNLCDD